MVSAELRNQLSKWIKISSFIVLLLGVSLTLAAFSNSMLGNLIFASRLILGLSAIAVGCWGIKTVYAPRKQDAKIYYYGLLTLFGIYISVNFTILVISRGIANQICSEESELSCSTLQFGLIAVSLVLIAFSTCVLLPFSYISRRYWQVLDSASELIISD